jgi:hypothetical protein
MRAVRRGNGHCRLAEARDPGGDAWSFAEAAPVAVLGRHGLPGQLAAEGVLRRLRGGESLMARKRDRIDLACEQWAIERRRIDAGDFRESNEWLGAVRCTIAERRDLHAGSTSQGRVAQHFPEVHLDDALSVARAVAHMNLTLREILCVHYGVRMPTKVKIERLRIAPRLYWDRVARVKTYVGAWIDHDDADAGRMDDECAA